MSEKIIEFECVYKTAKLAGYAYAEGLDDNEPLYFYDRNLGTQTSLQNAYWEGTKEDRNKLEKAFNEDSLFLQFFA